VTEGYAELISTHVITLQNVGNELLHGPRSDRTQQMLEDTLKPAVDKAVGRARSAVRGRGRHPAVRPQIKSSLATEAAGSPRDRLRRRGVSTSGRLARSTRTSSPPQMKKIARTSSSRCLRSWR